MNLPKISIITPVYNGEKTISKCLESIRNQDYPQNKIFHILSIYPFLISCGNKDKITIKRSANPKLPIIFDRLRLLDK